MEDNLNVLERFLDFGLSGALLVWILIMWKSHREDLKELKDSHRADMMASRERLSSLIEKIVLDRMDSHQSTKLDQNDESASD